eukprot:jgi/Psemu1/313418/fgenesh1_kg.1188_\
MARNGKNMSKSCREEPARDFRTSTKVNSDFKWKVDRSVVGALEVATDPVLDVQAELQVHEIIGYEEEFQSYVKVWKDLKLRNEFIKAFESLAPETVCCGLITDQDKTIRKNAKELNNGWVKSTNQKLIKEGFKLSVFVWYWRNISGKAETVIPMIRFHSISLWKEEMRRRKKKTNAI